MHQDSSTLDWLAQQGCERRVVNVVGSVRPGATAWMLNIWLKARKWS